MIDGQLAAGIVDNSGAPWAANSLANFREKNRNGATEITRFPVGDDS
jgi:hypothetical protein